MSTAHTTAPTRPRALLLWITGGAALAALIAVVTIAVWPASAADKAREDGRQYGEAVGKLSTAQSAADVDEALADIHTAAGEARAHAGDEVADHVADQEDALGRAVDAFVGAHTSGDAFEIDLYQAELNTALDDLGSQASDFRAQGPEVRQAFWEGFQDGLPGD
jgi:hypothetical protein